ncbi:T9SS type A sorting domain-containing protein [Flavobacterium daejeonense]|uniref:T9SS type A sorting domain-containing protein n=1 Tax=Flavobacterium daejeonense TaxID=350893 RepID=UPI0004795BE7|nr:T9SS type A sorting domain-containing protein [Flavobacterium daejeonense]
MNKLIAFLVLFIGIKGAAQDKILFTYDTAGNQIQRLLCINCTTSKMTEEKTKEITALETEDLLKFSPQDVISYYPNPVREELYLQWELIEGNYVTSIQLYDLNGRVLQSFYNLNQKNNQNIAFQSYPIGMYAVVLFYKSGEQKSIKIIKK